MFFYTICHYNDKIPKWKAIFYLKSRNYISQSKWETGTLCERQPNIEIKMSLKALDSSFPFYVPLHILRYTVSW